MTKQILLSQGKIALVDDEDYDYINQFKWAFTTQGYAHTYRRIDEKKTWVLMHREINKSPIGIDTDHIDGNRLNNQRSNLRNATRSQNMMNQKKTRGKSKYKGVSWSEGRNKWQAHIRIFGKSISLGRFSNETTAAIAYNQAALEAFGKYARLNII